MTIQYHDQRPEGYQGEDYEQRRDYQGNQSGYSQSGPGYGQYSQAGPQYGENQSYYQQGRQSGYGQYPHHQEGPGDGERPQEYGYGQNEPSYQNHQQYGSGYNQGYNEPSNIPAYPASDHHRDQGYQQQGGYGGYHSPAPPSLGYHSTPPPVGQGYPSPSPSNPYIKAEHTPEPYGQQPPPHDPYGQPIPQGVEGERGILGALAGGAAGAYAGHQVNHGFIGAVGGAFAGHKLEDAYKDHKKKKDHSSRRSSSSSSSSDEDKHHKHHQRQYAGNYSASSRGLSLHGTDLHAECRSIGGQYRWSRLDLNQCLTNNDGLLEWRRDGYFGGSARNVHLIDGGKGLEAELRTTDGHWRLSRIALDEKITNADGELRML